MWAAFIGAVLLSMLRRPDEDEEDRKKVIGLGEPQLDLFSSSLVDWMVPIRLWADGASLWRVIGRGVIEQIEIETKTTLESSWSNRDDILGDADPSSWTEEQTRSSAGGSYDVYVYVENDDKGHRPSTMMLVDHGQKRTPQISVPNIDMGVAEGSKAYGRLYDYATEQGWDLDEAEALRGEDGVVEDRVLEVLKRMKAELLAGREGEEIVKTLLLGDKETREIGVWARTFAKLWWAFRSHNAIVADRNNWEGASLEDETLERIRQEEGEEGEEVVRRILGEPEEEETEDDSFFRRKPRGEDAFYRYIKQKIEDLTEELNEGEKELLDLVEEEASDAEDLIRDLQIQLKDRSRFDEGRRFWALRQPWFHSGADSIDDLWLKMYDDRGIEYHFRDAVMEGTVGLLDSVVTAQYVEAESERRKRVEGVLWNFPGKYKDVWEIWALMGTCKPDGTVPLFLFLKVALDHGLLSVPAQKRYAKLLLLWEDPMQRMVEHDLVG